MTSSAKRRRVAVDTNTVPPEMENGLQDGFYPSEPYSFPTHKVSLRSPCLDQRLIQFQSQNDYLREFIPLRNDFLDIMMSCEAPPPGQSCLLCCQRQAMWRCAGCLDQCDSCTECLRDRHQHLPFHRVSFWNGTCYLPGWLYQAGVEIHLGHQGGCCPAPTHPETGEIRNDSEEEWCPKGQRHRPSPQDEDGWEDIEMLDSSWSTDGYGFPRFKNKDHVLIIDSSGAHPILITTCQCPGAPPPYVQYMSSGLFPATFKSVETAFTFGALDDFRLHNVECKTAVMSWWNRIKRITTPLQPDSVPVRSCSQPDI